MWIPNDIHRLLIQYMSAFYCIWMAYYIVLKDQMYHTEVMSEAGLGNTNLLASRNGLFTTVSQCTVS